jgi:UDP:flavonoid glycosyltransferase YjiC (YdhE family)
VSFPHVRILFASTRGAGHVTPLLPFARALQRAGDHVLVAVPRSAAALVQRAGLDCRPCDDPPEDFLMQAIGGPGRATISRDDVVREVFGGAFPRALVPGLVRAVEEWRPDVVLRETHELGSALVAERFGIPIVRVGIMRADGERFGIPKAAAALAGLRAELGLRPDPDGAALLAGPLFTLVPSQLEDPDEPAAGDVHRFREVFATGRRLADFWGGDRRPLVYATFGSEVPRTERFPALYREVLAELKDVPARVLLTVGLHRDPAALGPLPANAHVERWVDQADVLPHAAAVVCHGGSGTVRASLTAGLPLVLVPFFADQPVNAKRAEELGAGIVLESSAGLAEAVRRVLSEPGFGASAQRVAAEVQALPSVEETPGVLRRVLAAAA